MQINSIKLDSQEIAKLEALGSDIEVLERNIAKLKSIGVDTIKLETQLTAAKTLKDNLLKEFSTN